MLFRLPRLCPCIVLGLRLCLTIIKNREEEEKDKKERLG
jgi:hypothetical protein